ncbi:MAG: hypothetical protein KGL39_34020 [Patescibacteria group bacterium]|nr:hypothetical protein [Patescibacteria group bacterium]
MSNIRLAIIAVAVGLAVAAIANAGAIFGPVDHNDLPSCPDTSGNHLNYTTGSGALTCGTSSGGGGGSSIVPLSQMGGL